MYYTGILYYLIYLLSQSLLSQSLGEVTIYNTLNSELSYNQVNCLEFDGEERLWIGTQNGLSIFNQADNSWSNMYTENINCFPTNVITALEWDMFCEPEETMFIGTSQGMIYVSWEIGQFDTQGQNFTWSLNYGSECNPNTGLIKSILHNNNAVQVWAGTTDGLCVEGLVEKGDWVVNNTKTGFYSNNITSIKQNSNNQMIGIGTMNGGLLTYNNEFNIYYSSNSAILDNTVLDLAFDQNNNIIICTPQAGLGILTENESWIWLNTINSTLTTNSLRKVIVDNNNDLWIATLENGLIHYTNNTFYNYNSENSNLPDNKINCLTFGPNNHLWLGTDTSGIIKINNPINFSPELLNTSTRVYPTIFNSNINIELAKNADIHIFNEKGQLITSHVFSSGSHIIDVSSYNPGIYLMLSRTNHTIETYKLLKYN